MNQGMISKHIRITAYKTPILKELITISKRSSRPKVEHVDQLYNVWRHFPGDEQISYNHIPNMSINLSEYLSGSSTPTNANKKFSPKHRTTSNKTMKKNSRQNFLLGSRQTHKQSIKFSPETKNIALNISKKKIEDDENLLRPNYLAQQLPSGPDKSHKNECNCKIADIPYHQYANYIISFNKIFISCRVAAGDFPSLIKYNIYSVLTLGEDPNHFPSLKGGYSKLNIDNNTCGKNFVLASRFLNTQLGKGNVLVHDDSGNGMSCVIVMAYLLKETKISYSSLLELMKNIRPNFKPDAFQEKFIKSYEHSNRRS